MLKFDDILWSYVTVGTLHKRAVAHVAPSFVDPHIPADILAKVQGALIS